MIRIILQNENLIINPILRHLVYFLIIIFNNKNEIVTW